MAQSFIQELNRRNVFRVAAAYVVTAWLLIQVAETIFPLFGFGDTPARMVVVVLAIGFVPALVLAWVFEWTPEGLRRDADVDRGAPAALDNARRLDRIIMVMLALGLGYFAFDKFVLDPARDAEIADSAREEGRADAIIEAFGERSIAVLPFANMSADPEQEYFSDGMAEELLNLLARIPDLRVISRSSSFTYKGEDIPKIPTIAVELGVNYILEGSVRKAGDTIRITAQLIEARSDRHLWSDTYDRKLEDVFAIQDEISAAIVGELRSTLALDVGNLPQALAPANTEAHDAYLRGRYLLAQREINGAAREFERAISADPDYALAHAQLAIAYGLGFTDTTPTVAEAVAATRHHVEKAMALDPTIAEVHAAAASLAEFEGDLHSALKHNEKALEINPSYADVYTWSANILGGSLGRYREAFAMREKAVKLDPLSIVGLWNYVDQLIKRNRLTEADRELEKLASMAPDYYAQLRALRVSQGGNWANGVLALLEPLKPDLTDEIMLRFLAFMGLEQEALAIPEEVGPHVLILLGKPGQAVTAAQANLAKDPLAAISRNVLGLALAGAGDYAAAQPHLEWTWQRNGGEDVGRHFTIDHAVALIAAYRAAGEEEKVAVLLAAIRDNARRYEEAGITTSFLVGGPDYENGLALFLAGDDQRGLELIARAVKDGHFIAPGAAYLQDLYQHPGFAAIHQMQEARQAREREKFFAIVCSDNPYAAVWQPAEGTCEQFTAADGN